ncbi:copper amine oxidase N-terminal domain-containing protein [Cohnella luojiensis]|nr:copper amine oxidase N-terminal domain-containing protein [Cohnella luojiensis]
MKLRWITLVVLAITFLIPNFAYAETPSRFQFEWVNGTVTGGEVIIKNGVTYIETEDIFINAGFQSNWDSAHTRLQLKGQKDQLAFRMGSKFAIMNGKIVPIGGSPFTKNKRTYIPARFLVKVLGGKELKWSNTGKVLHAAGLRDSMTVSQIYGGLYYSVDNDSGTLYVTDAKGSKRKLATLEKTLYDFANFDFQVTSKGLLIITIYVNHGEPHLHYQLFTVIIKNGGVIRQSYAHYFNRYSPNVKQYDNHLILTDGKKLRVLEDGTGAVIETIDLVKLGGEDDDYFIEGMDDDSLLFRANQKGILKLYNRTTGEVVPLYKQLLDEKRQEYAETNETPYFGDNLVFIKREGQTLYFRNDSNFEREDTIYEYKLP